MNHEEVPVRLRRPVWVRVLGAGAVLLTAWQVFASFLWIAPYSANAREIVPGSALASYMLPFFGQSWSVFAPEPINGDYHFNVRAQILNEAGDTIETGWVSATDVELSMIRYNLAPPRAGIQSSEVASKLKGAYDVLTDVEKGVVQSSYAQRAELVAVIAAAAVDDEGVATGVASSNGSAFLSADEVATAYATQVAYAIWGDVAGSIVAVQYRVSRQNIIPFAQRHDPLAVRPEPMIVLPGWHEPVVREGQNQDAFTRVFRAQFERTQG